MTILLTGATGYVGAYVLRALRRHDHHVRCLVRDLTDELPLSGEGVEKVRGDITDLASLRQPVEGCDAVVHLVGIIDEDPSKGVTFERIHVEGTRHVVRAARDAGVERFVHMSANGARPDGVSPYQTSKWRGEQHVREAGFERWTIFRPSIVFGDPGPDHPEFAKQLARTLVRPFPLLPVFGDGSYRLQPIHVEEVAEAFAQALTTDAAAGTAYCAAGPDAFPYTEVLDRIAEGCGLRPKPKMPVPVVLVRPVIKLLAPTGLLPISPAQFEMLLDGNTCDARAFYDDFDLGTPTPFTPQELSYLQKYG